MKKKNIGMTLRKNSGSLIMLNGVVLTDSTWWVGKRLALTWRAAGSLGVVPWFRSNWKLGLLLVPPTQPHRQTVGSGLIFAQLVNVIESVGGK